MPFSDRFCNALQFTCRLHADQRRKVSGEPYVAHLLAVAALVIQYGGDEDEAIAALLHDAIEDQGGQDARREIHRRFGPAVEATVVGCSDSDTVPKPPWRRRKEAFIEQLGEASSSVRLVAAADKLDNVRSLVRGLRAVGQSLWEHFRGGRDGTLWYYRSVVDVLRRIEPNPLTDELHRTVAQLERLVHSAPSNDESGAGPLPESGPKPRLENPPDA